MSFLRHFLLVAVCVAMLGTTPRQVQASIFYGASHSSTSGASTFYTINATTGAATAVGGIGFDSVSGMDFAPNGTLYATGKRPGTFTTVLMTINPLTGAGTEIGSLGGGIRASSGLSFRNADGVLYASIRDTGFVAQTMTINLGTGAGTLLPNSTGFDQRGGGMGFSSSDVLFRSSHFSPTNLITVNQASGIGSLVSAVTYVGFPTSTSVRRLKSMDLDPNSGVMYAIVSDQGGGLGPEYLATVNLTTAQVTNVGGTAIGMDAFAVGPSAVIPEPTTFIVWSLLGLTASGVVYRRKRMA